MKVDPSPFAIVQDEVPRPVAWPWQDLIKATRDESGEERLEMIGRQPHVEVSVFPRLPLQQRVNAPATADADVNPMIVEYIEQRDHGLCCHDVLAHRSPF
jgi:hypothetical protein